MEAKKMGTPVIVLNMKSYAESAGRRVSNLRRYVRMWHRSRV